jgi:DNA-binding LacI/PurR family transcriptional regulator
VSPTAVSFVLNGRTDQGISAATRQAVLDTVQRLGYVPSASARALRSGRSRVVLCALPALPVARAIEQFKEDLSTALRDDGYTCVFVRMGTAEDALADILRDITPAVVLVLGELDRTDRKTLAAADVPVVDGILDPDRPGLSGIDQTSVGALQVRHLVERGHERIAYGVLDEPLEARFAEPRLQGARQACADRGLQLITERMVLTPESVRGAVHAWTTRERPVTAIAAFNDEMALGILSCLRQQGIRVPEDVAVIGVDDLPMAALVDPPLSTVRLDLELAARNVAARVLQLTQGGGLVPVPVAAPFAELVLRSTT